MNEPFFKLNYYDLDNPDHAAQYRAEVFKVAQRFAGDVNYQAEMASVSKRANMGFYRSTEGQDLAIELLERWPEDFADEDKVSDQARAEAIQLEVCHEVLKDVDGDWMDEVEDDEE
jgi:hypothetical protein